MDELTNEHDEVVELADDLPGESRLAPRVAPAARRRRKNPFALVALVVIVGALLVVVMNGLGDATLFFRNTDEAVAQRVDLTGRTFRIQGLVAGETITDTDRGVDFVITYNGIDVTISHLGEPPDLFQPGIPVVLEGRWARVGESGVTAPHDALPTDDGWFFASDRFFVKHTEVYTEDNPDRVEYYDDGDAAGTGGHGAGDDGGSAAGSGP